ncbi:hypothetical protein CSC17_1632 [Klebsiella oxytoca]|nr:hypothetical protein CSC17_1632 [Klebsiella oxytoca]
MSSPGRKKCKPWKGTDTSGIGGIVRVVMNAVIHSFIFR